MRKCKKVEQIYNYINYETNIANYKQSIDIDDHFKKYLEQQNIDPKKNQTIFKRI